MTNFQTLVKNSKLSLKEISEATGIGYSTLGNYNQGSRSPNAKNAQILSEYFGVSIPYLLGLDDNPVLKDPGAPKEMIKDFYKVLTKGTIILAELNQSEALSDYIDFLATKKGFNPVLVKAVKEFIADEKQGLIPFLINKSGAEDSPYHYVWEAWINSDEYKRRQEEKKSKK